MHGRFRSSASYQISVRKSCMSSKRSPLRWESPCFHFQVVLSWWVKLKELQLLWDVVWPFVAMTQNIIIGCPGDVHHILLSLHQQPWRTTYCWQGICGSLPLQPPSVPDDHAALPYLEHHPGQRLCETSQQVPQERWAGSKHGGMGSWTSIG